MKRGLRAAGRRTAAVAASPVRPAIGKKTPTKATTRAERRKQRELDGDLLSSSDSDAELLDPEDALGFTEVAVEGEAPAAEDPENKDL